MWLINLYTLLELGVGLACALVSFMCTGPQGTMAAGLSLFAGATVCDLVIRIRHGNEFFDNYYGGHVWFVPVWLVGALFLAVGVISGIAELLKH